MAGTFREDGLALSSVQTSSSGAVALFHTAHTGPGERGYLVCDLHKEKRFKARRLGPAATFAAALSPDGKVVAHAIGSGAVKRAAADTGKPIGEDLPIVGAVRALAYSPDGKRLAACAGQLSLLGLPDGKPVCPPLDVPGRAALLAFSRDGEQVAVAGGNEARVWQAATGQQAFPPIRQQATVTACEFSGDGKFLLTAGEDGGVRLWAARSGKPALAPLWLVGPARHATFSPDGRWVAACGPRLTRVWSTSSGLPLCPPLPQEKHEAAWLAFSPDGLSLAAATRDRALIWALPRAEGPAEKLEAGLSAYLKGDLAPGRSELPALFSVTAQGSRAFYQSRLHLFGAEHRLALPHYDALARAGGPVELVALCRACRRAQKWTRGLEAVDQLLRVNPKAEGARGLRGSMLLGLGRAEEAIKELARVPAGGADRGLAFLALGRWREADEALKSSRDPALVALSALLAGDQARYQKACEKLAPLLEGPVGDVNAPLVGLFVLGPAKAKGPVELPALARRALAQAPNSPRRLLILGLAHLRAGQPAAALAPLKRCEIEGPPAVRGMAMYALALPLDEATTRLGRARAARRACRRMDGPDHAWVEALARQAEARFRPVSASGAGTPPPPPAGPGG